jgi:glycosyltransferase 2 family protein
LSSQLKKVIQFAIILLVGGFFIYFAFKGTDWNDLLLKISHANWLWLGIGMIVSLLSHWLRGYRATLLYEAMNYKVGSKNSFYAVIIGYMMNYFIPRAGEVSRCASINKTDGVPVEKGLGSVVTERLVDMAILLLILGIIFLIQFDLIVGFIQHATANNHAESSNGGYLKYVILGLLAIGSIALFAFRKKLMQMPLYVRIVSLVQGFADGLLSIRHLKNPTLFIILSILIWSCYILMMYFCMFSMEATASLSFSDCLTVFVIGTIGIVLPAPGAGAGTYHFFVMQSLLLFGVAKEDGIAYATLVHGAQMVLLIALGIIVSVIIYMKKGKDEQARSSFS